MLGWDNLPWSFLILARLTSFMSLAPFFSIKNTPNLGATESLQNPHKHWVQGHFQGIIVQGKSKFTIKNLALGE